MSVIPTSVTVQMYLGGSWVSVAADVMSDPGIHVEYGIPGNGPLDLVAGTGTMTFDLNNSSVNSAGQAGYYSPMRPECRAGFDVGIPVRLSVIYDGKTFYKFYGTIPPDGIQVDPGLFGELRTHVLVCDFMEQAAIHQIRQPTLADNQRIDQAMPLIIANMPIAPLTHNWLTGVSTFPTVFDMIEADKTTALSEMAKLARSEMCYIYVYRDQATGEVLRNESRTSRIDSTPLTRVFIPSGSEDHMVWCDGTPMGCSNGVDIFVGTAETVSAAINKLIEGQWRCPAVVGQVSYGRNLYNWLKFQTYPRLRDTSNVVLFSLNESIVLAMDETREVTFTFRDPGADPDKGTAQHITAKDIVTPVHGADFMAYDDPDAGSDFTGSITLAVVSSGAESITYSFHNTHGGTLYVRTFVLRGKGNYIYDPTVVDAVDTVSQAQIGTRILQFDMPYQDHSETAQGIASYLLTQLSSPSNVVDTVSFVANRDALSMATFLTLEPGSKVSIGDEQTGVDDDFFINHIAFDILAGGKFISVSYIPTAITFSAQSVWRLGVAGFGELEVSTYLG